jgi:hypothetical protein
VWPGSTCPPSASAARSVVTAKVERPEPAPRPVSLSASRRCTRSCALDRLPAAAHTGFEPSHAWITFARRSKA